MAKTAQWVLMAAIAIASVAVIAVASVAFAIVFLIEFMAIAVSFSILLIADFALVNCMNISRKISACGGYVKNNPTPFWSTFDYFVSITVGASLSAGQNIIFACELCFQIFLTIFTMIVTAVEISILFYLSVVGLSFAPTAVSGLVRIFGSSILQLPSKAGFVVYATLSGVVCACVAVLSCGIAASALVAAISWVASAAMLAALGICMAEPAPGQPSPAVIHLAHFETSLCKRFPMCEMKA